MKKLIFLSLSLFFTMCRSGHQASDHLGLEPKLSGKWVATAFDGELHEEWHLNEQGWMQQQGYYIEKGDTAYAAKTQIQKVGEDIILFSVIKDSNPKIFKATQFNEKSVQFKNDDYSNPSEVTYDFLSPEEYKRTIKGMEGDSLVVYEFQFVKAY